MRILLANDHGALAALPAALKQAVYTLFASGFIVRLCENLITRVKPMALAWPLAIAVPTLVAVGLTGAAQLVQHGMVPGADAQGLAERRHRLLEAVEVVVRRAQVHRCARVVGRQPGSASISISRPTAFGQKGPDPRTLNTYRFSEPGLSIE